MVRDIIKDLENLPVRDAVFHNDQKDVVEVVERIKISKVIKKYEKEAALETLEKIPLKIYQVSEDEWWAHYSIEEAAKSYEETTGNKVDDEIFYELKGKDLQRESINLSFNELLEMMKEFKPGLFCVRQ